MTSNHNISGDQIQKITILPLQKEDKLGWKNKQPILTFLFIYLIKIQGNEDWVPIQEGRQSRGKGEKERNRSIQSSLDKEFSSS